MFLKTGKSFLIDCLSQLVEKHESSDFMLLAAPTGSAAFNISGSTMHTLFQLQCNYKPDNPAPLLDGDQLKRLQSTCGRAWLLILDEKSMISTTRLFQLHERLKQVHPEIASDEAPFGGFSIIMFGDYAQLPPVKERAVYDSIQNTGHARNAQMAGAALYSQFDKVIVLDEIVRQQGMFSNNNNNIIIITYLVYYNDNYYDNRYSSSS